MKEVVEVAQRAKVPACAAAKRVAKAGILLVLLSGCQSIPDVSVWNQATKDITGAVTSGFQAAASVNGDMARRLGESPAYAEYAARYASAAQSLGNRAGDYERLFGAIADYSGSLAAIARASDNSQKTVDAVAGSVNQLVTAVGGTALAGAGFELAKTLFNEVIKIKAAQDFGDAVQKADPVIGQIADLLVKDLADLQRTVGASKEEAIRAAITDPRKTQLEYRASLDRRRASLQAAISRAIAATPPRSLLNSDEALELGRVEQYLRDADVWYKPLQDDLGRALQLRAKSEDLALQAGRAVEAWRASHASVAAAVRERRVPESGRLAALATRIRDLASDLKKENQP
jgi:hypothetical protein